MKNKIESKFSDLSGSVADFGTIIPIVMAASLVAGINAGIAFMFIGIWYIVSGLYYGVPVAVEPMKAIGAAVIAGGFTAAEISASGLIIGVFFLILGFSGGMNLIRKYTPEVVIRGIQIALALLLLKSAVIMMSADLIPALAILPVIIFFWLLSRARGIPDLGSVAAVIIGVAAGVLLHGASVIFRLSVPSLVLPAFPDLLSAGWYLVIPQIPLTITNAVLATSLLARDLYHRDIPDGRLSRMIGVMNIISAPLGAFPMCHGAGGLAAHYRFGAKTGMSAIIAGVILLGFSLFLSSPSTLEAIPQGVFAALLIFVSIELFRQGSRTESYMISGIMGIIALVPFIGMAGSFIFGLAAAYAKKRISGA